MSERMSVSTDQGKVIHLERFLSGVSLSPIRQIEAYWTALGDEGAIPVRSQIDPRGLSAALEYTFILERIAPGIARFRIAGQHLCDLAGMEVRGMPLTAFFTPAGRAEIGATLEKVFDTPAIAELGLNSMARRRRKTTTARMLMLPLRSDAGRVDRILGGLMTSDRRMATPAALRFEVDDIRFRPVSGHTAPPIAPVPTPADPSGFAEAAPDPVSPAPRSTTPIPSAPYLRLIKTDTD
ncbi:MAG: PAS domain-containing protein [Marinibacterium sp.]